MNTKNVYIVLTEYQLLQALNIATSIYNVSTITNVIYIVQDVKRLKGVDATLDYNCDNIVFIFLDNRQPKEIAKKILTEKPNHFLIFQGTSALNVYLGYALSNQGAEISLGPDGYSAYAIYNKRYEMLTIIKDSIIQNKNLIANKLFSGKIHIFNYYTYGNHHFIDNLWVTHPEAYNHRGKNKVKIFKLPDFNENCLNIISKLFNFSLDYPTNGVIYFFNQPLWIGLLDLEYNFLLDVIKKFPQKQIVLKLHPHTSIEMKDKYKTLERVQIIESDFPAEILLLSLENCIVYSGWSTVLITENGKCNYYFNYPIYRNSCHKNLNQVEIPALNHIKMIKSPQEMNFPVETHS